jgi:lambda family phage portal protein
MSKRTPTSARASAASARRRVERAELTARQLEARLKTDSLRAAIKAQKAMLATYGAADRGRRNKDWKASGISADLAIIPDAEVMNARARQMVRDSWIAQSAVSAYSRNVIGCGIIPVPQAKDTDGELDTDLNKQLMLDFWTWASDRIACDVEQEQTFWQMQSLAESERATVGETFWIWAYEPPRRANGGIDTRRPVGLKLQAFEPEQLDLRILSYIDPVTGLSNEVRGGIEIDRKGVKVAYHVYTRNPNDYLFQQQSLQSKRIPADRVLHYYRKLRVRQKRGVTPLAPVLQDMRDLARYKDAALWRVIMEACIGVMVKRDPTGGSAFPGILPRATGDTGTTASGMTTVDWVPGMVADPGPGNSLEPFIPQAPGGQYEPFTRQTIRGVAAGAGISYGQLSRDFTQGTYSGQRQEMLEDRKEFEPLQEMCAHNLILPVFRMFVAFMALEGRIDAPDYATDPARYTAAEYVAPPPTWIDPKAEADALDKLIRMRVITREEVAHLRGHRLADILSKIASEKKEADDLGITFEEDVEAQAALAKAEAATAPPPAPENAPVSTQNDPKTGENDDSGDKKGDLRRLESAVHRLTVLADEAEKQLKSPSKSALLEAKTPREVPNYRDATPESAANCAACRFYVDGTCQAYDFAAVGGSVCDAFEVTPALEDPNLTGGRIIGPSTPDGERPINDPQSTFNDRGERGVQ